MTDLAWVAGLFEGEGSIGFTRRRLQLQISMTDKDVLERVGCAVGWGHVTGPYRRASWPGRYKSAYHYVASGRIAYAVAVAIYPWLGERRQAQVREALQGWLSIPAGSGGPTAKQWGHKEDS